MAPSLEEDEEEEPVAPRPGDQGYIAPSTTGSSGSAAAQSTTQQVNGCITTPPPFVTFVNDTYFIKMYSM